MTSRQIIYRKVPMFTVTPYIKSVLPWTQFCSITIAQYLFALLSVGIGVYMINGNAPLRTVLLVFLVAAVIIFSRLYSDRLVFMWWYALKHDKASYSVFVADELRVAPLRCAGYDISYTTYILCHSLCNSNVELIVSVSDLPPFTDVNPGDKLLLVQYGRGHYAWFPMAGKSV